MNTRDYQATVRKIADPGQEPYFKAYTDAFGELVNAYGESPEAALTELYGAVLPFYIKELENDGLPVPEPDIVTGRYSGKFIVRLPKTLHETLDRLASQEGVSLNALVQTLLANAVGERSGKAKRSA